MYSVLRILNLFHYFWIIFFALFNGRISAIKLGKYIDFETVVLKDLKNTVSDARCVGVNVESYVLTLKEIFAISPC